MKDFYKHLNINSYSSIEWKLMKVSFSWIWFLSLLSILYKYNFAPIPESIFKLFPAGFYLSTNAKILLFIANLILICCYILEKYFWWSLLGLSLISLFGFSCSFWTVSIEVVFRGLNFPNRVLFISIGSGRNEKK